MKFDVACCLCDLQTLIYINTPLPSTYYPRNHSNMSYNHATVAASTSPSGITIHDRLRNTHLDDIRRPRVLHPLENEGLRFLILENISQDAVAQFRGQGWHVDHLTKALNEDELVARIGTYHAIGIRSKTKITKRVLQAASKVRSRNLAYDSLTSNLIASCSSSAASVSAPIKSISRPLLVLVSPSSTPPSPTRAQ